MITSVYIFINQNFYKLTSGIEYLKRYVLLCWQLIIDSGNWINCDAVFPQIEIPDNGIDEDCDGEDLLCLGDSDNNGCVDILDLVMIGTHFGETSVSGEWNPRADINTDNEIDIFDLVIVGSNFGNEYIPGSC